MASGCSAGSTSCWAACGRGSRAPGLEAGGRERHIRSGPGACKAGVYVRSLDGLPLRAQRVCQPEERPAAFREPLEVFAIQPLGLDRAARLQQYRGQGVADRVIPVGRLGIELFVLDLHRLAEMRDALLERTSACR